MRVQVSRQKDRVQDHSKGTDSEWGPGSKLDQLVSASSATDVQRLEAV
jgi:hypothetical protein